MARISKPGLDYFPLDVNFFQDRKVRRISNRHHAAGIAALTSLLCLIYKEKGFYVAWNQDTLFDISQEVCCEEEEMQGIIDDCLSVGLFDTYIYKEYGILTSQAIQEKSLPTAEGNTNFRWNSFGSSRKERMERKIIPQK